MKGYFRKLIYFSSVDGPGNRTIIFLQGCNFDCKYCHNPETINIIEGNNIPKNVELLDHIELVDMSLKHKDFINGITISGGECTYQFEFLVDLCKEYKKRDINVFIDTNGYFTEEQYNILSKYVDKFMFDLKAFNNKEHKLLTGKENLLCINNIKKALKDDKVFEIRTVIVPSLLNNFRNVYFTSELIYKFSTNKNIRYKLIKYRANGVRKRFRNFNTPSDDYMMELKRVSINNGVINTIIV
ncbi:radical SAM protein [Helicovermis profundi]|uniref:YjjW family glycine radical enzyme activase n=1 Tax=Helicovermis profundi TaxID=3065157 RepID=A0AAU9EHX9_9FIRM|nr:YjjW family glycine radical enzyme activase [Clostridia bacterium S502]